MSDETNPAPAGADTQAPTVRVLGQYVKDLSFENPAAPGSLRTTAPQPKFDMSLDVGARRLDDPVYEVELRIKVEAKRDETVLFIAELTYGGAFEFRNTPPEALDQLILIEAPRMLFPFARRILGDVTRDGGYVVPLIDPIDFAGLYLAQRQAQAQGDQSPTAPLQTPPADS